MITSPWITYDEAAMHLVRKKATIYTVMSLWKMPRLKIRQGRHPRKIALMSRETLYQLALRMHGPKFAEQFLPEGSSSSFAPPRQADSVKPANEATLEV